MLKINHLAVRLGCESKRPECVEGRMANYDTVTLREGVRGRSNLKGELFTLTLTLTLFPAFAETLRAGRRQGKGNYFKISKSGFGLKGPLDNCIYY